MDRLSSKDNNRLDVTLVHARRVAVLNHAWYFSRPGSSVRFPNACFGACAIGKHDFTGRRSETWLSLVCVVPSGVGDD